MQQDIEAFRRFNRFYTRQIGLLNQTLLDSDYSLTQARILFELAHRQECTASDLMDTLEMDAGYVSRTITGFEKQGIVKRVPSKKDSRERLLKLTSKGKKIFGGLNERSSKQAQTMLEKLSVENRGRILHCMKTIETVLQPSDNPPPQSTLRSHAAGDIGWIIHRHGVLYSEEYGWDETFEALVADILVRFVQKHNPDRERIWIAELHGERVGSVMLVDAGENVAQLRLLLVEPWARGYKIGRQLVDACRDFSREKGYDKIKLWTQSNLFAARQLYISSGYTLVEKKPHRSFGKDLVAEIWELPLK
jgi:DNA-binding MarR family transcriptional regulator/GNAT superfamily N-acetyltransferase